MFQTNNPVTFSRRVGQQISSSEALPEQAIQATIDALAQEGLIKDLAEPDLVAMNGQTASFLAGGEFPVPISGSSRPRPAGPDDHGRIQELRRQPRLYPDDHRRPSPKSAGPARGQRADDASARFGAAHATATVTIPALTVRRAETSVELGSGESFALAGLLQHTSEQDISKVPLLGDIPILGALFRSDRFQRNETELVIIVTPYLVNPVATRLAAPTDGLVLPSDPQRVLFSDKYRQGLPAPARGPLNAGGKGLIGPGGFRLD